MNWTVPRAWAGETAFILGGGPSLSAVDCNQLRGQRVIAINNSWELTPWATVLYFCDAKWFKRYTPKDPVLASYKSNGEAIKVQFRGEYVVTISEISDLIVKRLKNSGRSGLETDAGGLRHGSNSGYQAMNLAVLFGAARIVLLGYDMKVDGDRTNWHEGHGAPVETVDHRITQTFLPYFKELVEPLRLAGVEVINATHGSALKLWPYRPLEEILAET